MERNLELPLPSPCTREQVLPKRRLVAWWRTPGRAPGTVAAAATTIICWGSAYPAIRAGVTAYSPAHLVLLRCATASVVLLLYAITVRMPFPRPRDLPALAGTGVIGIALYAVLLTSGEVSVPASTASFLIACSPIFLALLAAVVLGDRPSRWGWLGIGTSFVGVAGISLAGGAEVHVDLRALVVVVAALAQAVYFTTQRPLLGRYTAAQCTAFATWGATLGLLLFSPGLAAQFHAASLKATLATVYLGVFPSSVGYATWAYVLHRLPAASAAGALYLVPPAASMIAWIWLGEMPSIASLLGGAVVLAGVVLVTTRGSAQRSRGAEVSEIHTAETS